MYFLTLMVVVFYACTKEPVNESLSLSGDEQRTLNHRVGCDPKQAYMDLAEALLQDANSVTKFKTIVYDQCFQQPHGDYYIRVSELLVLNQKLNFWTKNRQTEIEVLVEACKCQEDVDPIIFVPYLEYKSMGDIAAGNLEAEIPLAVLKPLNEDEEESRYISPGYILDKNDQLVYSQDVDETYAWKYPVWVVGQEEVCFEENMIAATNDDGNPNARVQGGAEYGGIVQCTDLGKIEPWTSGKLEFYNFVMNSSGARIGGIAFGKWKRDNFRNNKWEDFNYKITNWNTANFGNYMYENWWEDDGGNSKSVTITMPPPAGSSGPTISTTAPSHNRDDNFGVSVVQFTDPLSEVYQLSYMNFKRRF